MWEGVSAISVCARARKHVVSESVCMRACVRVHVCACVRMYAEARACVYMCVMM